MAGFGGLTVPPFAFTHAWNGPFAPYFALNAAADALAGLALLAAIAAVRGLTPTTRRPGR